MEYSYIAIYFYDQETNQFWATIPDLKRCFSSGETIEELVTQTNEAMTEYLLSLLNHGEALPKSSSISHIVKKYKSPSIFFAKTNLLNTTQTKTVKKTVSIPMWLNEAAKAKHINFSQTLQEALLKKVKEEI